jgi:hypothetical protein
MRSAGGQQVARDELRLLPDLATTPGASPDKAAE